MGKGRFTAGVGLPCIGKSSVFGELANLLDGVALLEPEEENWPAAVTAREQVGYFTGLMWFRAARIPMYYAAEAARAAGKAAFLDSYYDKLCDCWLGKPGMDWLLDPSDPYFPIASEIARLDREILPLADTLVLFTVDRPVWERFIAKRGRKLDDDSRLAERYAMQEHFILAAEALAAETGIRLVSFHQDRFDDSSAAAGRLAELLARI